MFILRWLFKFITIIVVFVVGVVFGGYIVTRVQPRKFLHVDNCQTNCYKPNELLGLAASVGLQYAPGLIPNLVMETEKSVVVTDKGTSDEPVHYVIIPKKDIKNISEVGEEDNEYIMDVISIIGQLVRNDNLSVYRVVTNGPGYQKVTYLHFHLMGRK